MTTDAYPIRPCELQATKNYLNRKREALGATAILELRDVRALDQFEAWRQRHLSATAWTRLRATIRQHRHQQTHRGHRARLAVSAATRDRIHQEAKRAGLTVDQTINQLLENPHHVQQQF